MIISSRYLALLIIVCTSCGLSDGNSARIQLSGSHIPSVYKIPNEDHEQFSYVADVDKSITDRSLTITLLPVAIQPSGSVGFGSPMPSYLYRFRMENRADYPVPLGRITIQAIGEKGNVSTTITPVSSSAIDNLNPRNERILTFNYNWKYGAALQIALIVEREDGNNGVYVFVALARLAERL